MPMFSGSLPRRILRLRLIHSIAAIIAAPHQHLPSPLLENSNTMSGLSATYVEIFFVFGSCKRNELFAWQHLLSLNPSLLGVPIERKTVPTLH